MFPAWVELGALLLAGVLAAPQEPSESPEAERPERLVQFNYTMKFQPANEALSFIYPLLSERGTVELQADGGALTIQDTPEVLRRVVPRLRRFDHQVRPLSLKVQIVRATTLPVDAGRGPRLSEELAGRLRRLLRYDGYELMAAATLHSREGGQVQHRMDTDYEVRFRLGTMLEDRSVRLHGFKVLRRGAGDQVSQLIQTSFKLQVDEPMILGLARDEASDEALMLVLTCTETGSS